MSEYLVQLEYLLRIVLACICGMLIGYERKTRSKEAGVRTHVIVALGSALMMIVSKYGFYDSLSFDASRIASQIVSGVGFLGAGIIFVRHQSVSGLTTAAGIWATAGVGMAIGAGMYILGIGTCLLLFLIQMITHLSRLNHRQSNGDMIIVAENLQNISEIQHLLDQHNIRILDMSIHRNREWFEIHLSLRYVNEEKFQGFMNELEDLQEVRKVIL